MSGDKKVVSFVITPFYRSEKGIILQSGGADEKTCGYYVYKRLEDRSLVWHDEWPTEGLAINAAQTLARFACVPVENYDWQKLKMPSLAEKDKAFEEFVKNNPHLATNNGNAKIIWTAACEWMRQVFGAQM